MADYTRLDGSAMRRDAQRRARQMRQNVPTANHDAKRNPYTENPERERASPKEERPDEKERSSNILRQLPFGIDRLFSQLDSDRMLILAILVMLYKDGGNRNLMMALAYLLT